MLVQSTNNNNSNTTPAINQTSYPDKTKILVGVAAGALLIASGVAAYSCWPQTPPPSFLDRFWPQPASPGILERVTKNIPFLRAPPPPTLGEQFYEYLPPKEKVYDAAKIALETTADVAYKTITTTGSVLYESGRFLVSENYRVWRSRAAIALLITAQKNKHLFIATGANLVRNYNVFN